MKPRLNITIDPEDKTEWENMAKKMGVSVAGLIRLAVNSLKEESREYLAMVPVLEEIREELAEKRAMKAAQACRDFLAAYERWQEDKTKENYYAFREQAERTERKLTFFLKNEAALSVFIREIQLRGHEMNIQADDFKELIGE